MLKLLCLSLLSLPLLLGCSIHHALSTPSPVRVETVTVGQNRNNIIATLGVPKSTEVKPNGKTDIYEFVDGFSAGSKSRVVLYIAGDFFTLGLSELVFWPIELAAGNGKEGRAIVDYGMDNLAQNVMLTKRDGSPYDR